MWTARQARGDDGVLMETMALVLSGRKMTLHILRRIKWRYSSGGVIEGGRQINGVTAAMAVPGMHMGIAWACNGNQWRTVVTAWY